MAEYSEKVKKAIDLLNRTKEKITYSGENWKEYLDTASTVYKYNAVEQMMIYAQRPNATACAEIPLWNQNYNKYIKKGTKAIALLEYDKQSKPVIKNVFDVGDTVNSRGAKEPEIWKVGKELQEELIQRLYQDGKMNRIEGTFAEQLAYAVDVHLSTLEAFDNLPLAVKEFVKESVTYSALKRCGADADSIVNMEVMDNVENMGQFMTVKSLTSNIADLSKTILSRTEKSVKKIIKENQFSVDKREKIIYDKVEIIQPKIRSQAEKEEEQAYERENGNDIRAGIRTSRGLSDSEVGTGSGGLQSRKVRTDEGEVSRGTQTDGRTGTQIRHGMVATSRGSRQENESDDRGSSGENDGSRGSDGRTQSTRSAEMDGASQQLDTGSRGTHSTANDFQLKIAELDELPTVEEQIAYILSKEGVEESTPSFDLENTIATTWKPYFRQQSVYTGFSLHQSEEERIQVLKNYTKFNTYNDLFEVADEGIHSIADGVDVTWKEMVVAVNTLISNEQFIDMQIVDFQKLKEEVVARENLVSMENYFQSNEWKHNEVVGLQIPNTPMMVLFLENVEQVGQMLKNNNVMNGLSQILDYLKNTVQKVLVVRVQDVEKCSAVLKENGIDHTMRLLNQNKEYEEKIGYIKELPQDTVEVEEEPQDVDGVTEEPQDVDGVTEESQDVEDSGEPKKKFKNDFAHRNYVQFEKQFPQILTGEYLHMQFEGEPWQPLNIERIADDEIAISHTYIQNGDLMRDPEIVFRFDPENQTITPLSHQLDSLGIYREVFQDDMYNPTLLKELNSFLNDWLKNLQFQDRELVRAAKVIDGEYVHVTFADGKEVVEQDVDFTETQTQDVVGKTTFDRYEELKTEHEKAVVFVQKADFYETYHADAFLLQDKMDVTILESHDAVGNVISFAGVPSGTIDSVAEMLNNENYDVVVASDEGIQIYEVAQEIELAYNQKIETIGGTEYIITEPFKRKNVEQIQDILTGEAVEKVVEVTEQEELATAEELVEQEELAASDEVEELAEQEELATANEVKQSTEILTSVELMAESKESVQEIMYSSFAPMFVRTAANFEDVPYKLYSDGNGKNCVLGYGQLGNGTTVWNFLEMENLDYTIVAHIGVDGEVSIYDPTLPSLAIDEIERVASESKMTAVAEQEVAEQEEITTTDEELTDEVDIDSVEELDEEFMQAVDDAVAEEVAKELAEERAELLIARTENYSLFEENNGTGFFVRDDRTGLAEGSSIDRERAMQMLIDAEHFDRLPEYIGASVEIKGRSFRIDSVNIDSKRVSVFDLKTANSYPIFAEISTGELFGALKERMRADREIPVEILVEQQRDAEQEIEPQAVVEPPKAPLVNFKITDQNLGEWDLREKFARNIAAIKTLKSLEERNENATPKEQEIMSQYVGWGGLQLAFTESERSWAKEYSELKDLLNHQEYNSASGSTVVAYYTAPVVIQSIYQALENMEIHKDCSILEPSMGVGNFFGMLPEHFENAKLHGVEIDSISGRLAKQLYPNARVDIKAFQDVRLEKDTFDVVIGNVPFGTLRVLDKEYRNDNHLIHDYFFVKSLDKVKAGGIVAFITSMGTMNKKNNEVRRKLAEKGELLGAIRLPNTTFKKNADTSVVSDIIFLQKRENPIEITDDMLLTDSSLAWVSSNPYKDDLLMNQYFIDRPEMILGEMFVTSGRFHPTLDCRPNENLSLGEQLQVAITMLDQPNQELIAHLPKIQPIKEDVLSEITEEQREKIKNYSYGLIDGKVVYRSNDMLKEVDASKTAIERIKLMVGIRDTTREILDMQVQGCSDEELSTKQTTLNQQYDAYVKKFDIISSRGSSLAFRDDSSYPLLRSLENLDNEGNFESKSAIFSKRTIQQVEVVSNVDTPAEALAVCLSEKSCVDIPFMASILRAEDSDTQKKMLEIIEELNGIAIFKNPYSATADFHIGWQTADEYLSGNIRRKLVYANEVAKTNDFYKVNVEKLEKAMPVPLTAAEIDVRIGATWIPVEYYQDFMLKLFSTPAYLRDEVEISFSNATNLWHISNKSKDSTNPKVHSVYGTNRMSAYAILEDTLNLKIPVIRDPVTKPDNTVIYVVNPKETSLAQTRQEELEQQFTDWIFQDADRRNDLVERYNITYNSSRPREFDGSYLNFVGMNPEITLRTHQKNAIARCLLGENTMLAHVVGAGKSATRS